MVHFWHSNKHKCDLYFDSDSCLPKLAPNTGCYKKLRRTLRKITLISTKNMFTNVYFRSRAMRVVERKRHIRGFEWFIVHPFSILTVISEIFFSILWLFSYVKDPYWLATKNDFKAIYSSFPYRSVEIFVCVVLFLNVPLNLCTGYRTEKTQTIVLSFKQIVLRYLKTYFIFDLLGSFPSIILVSNDMCGSRALCEVIAFFPIFKFVRYRIVVKYFRHITNYLKMSDTMHEVMFKCIGCFLLLHWFTCLALSMPKYIEMIYGYKPPHYKLNRAPGVPEELDRFLYIPMLHIILCHFSAAGNSMITITTDHDFFIFSMTMIFGQFYMIYLMVMVIYLTYTVSSSECKYEQMVCEVKQYALAKKLSAELTMRLVIYYENKFRKRFFKESAILADLTDNIRDGVVLETKQYMLNNSDFFKILTKDTLSVLANKLHLAVYLPNDLLYKVNSTPEYMYFISYGKVAFFSPDGKEMFHMEDGDLFGEQSLLRKKRRSVNSVAVDVSEVYKLSKRDFMYMLRNYESFNNAIRLAAEKRKNLMTEVNLKLLTYETMGHTISHQLSKGQILEKKVRRGCYTDYENYFL